MQVSTTVDLEATAREAKAAAKTLAKLSTAVKNQALEHIAQGLLSRKDDILAANAPAGRFITSPVHATRIRMPFCLITLARSRARAANVTPARM